MIILNKPGNLIVSSHKIAASVERDVLTIATEHDRHVFRKGESMNPRILVTSVEKERIVNLQFVPIADSVKSIYMPDYDTAEKFLTFIETFIEG